MRRRLHILFFLLTGILLTQACRTLPLIGTDEDQCGNLILCLGSELATKATSESSPADGDLFHNVLIIIADNNGHVVDKVYKSYPCPAQGNQSAVNADDLINGGLDYDKLYFVNLRVGYYQVYAYANIEQSDWMTADTEPGEYLTVERVEKLLNLDDELDVNRQFRVFPELSQDVPAKPTQWMLLTGHDELYVGVEENIGQVDLYRPVTRFSIILDNHTDYEVALNSLTFNKFNASRSFIIAHRDENGNLISPTETNFRELPAFGSAQTIQAHSRKTVYSVLLYENRTEEDYRMFANVTINKPDPQTQEKPTLDLSSSGVRRVPFSEIATMQPNSSMTVIMANPNTASGKFFGWNGSAIIKTDAAFNFEDGYRNKAKALMDESSYLLTLSKDLDGKYHLKRGTKDFFNDFVDKQSALTLVQGDIPTNQKYPISSEFKKSLCQFKSSNNKFFYNNNGSLGNTSSDTGFGDKMWVFYEVEPLGTVLRLIDNKTSRVSTLTQMLRGQELNAVMNIYYETQQSDFSFTVDNAYWATEVGHSSSHIFQ